MLRNVPEIKLYGADGCHKTRYYQLVLESTRLPFAFLDVEADEGHASELRSLYTNGKLNFPTITIGRKKLRNPYKDELFKWLHKLIPSMLEIKHDKEAQKFTMDINGEEARVEYNLRDGKMYLVHSEVPYQLRGRGIGKELVLKTFEKLTEEGYKAVAICTYIKAIKNRDPKWKEIIE
ncbi:N-acetyltransferase [Allomuricauda sp. ARW1Y1]|jgi:predicted GNAT family acetyltransferase|uniref:N-acetyltransferase n=1 Tax=Allomuricauda sp. ARW1Y1 TaxID=2663843 RepID=UPI00179DEA22|nr:N-acetyltransferase [Muricauda sp. ARW1Y1]NYJ28081.1 putative GNAT family acetyltransferase [Muricauda sp. ARW1Y1]